LKEKLLSKKIGYWVIAFLISLPVLLIGYVSAEGGPEVPLEQKINPQTAYEFYFFDEEENTIPPGEVDVEFDTVEVSGDYAESTATVGKPEAQLRIKNPTDMSDFTLNVAPNVENDFEEEAVWKHTEEEESYPIYSEEPEDGQMTVDPGKIELNTKGECEDEDIEKKLETSFGTEENEQVIGILSSTKADLCQIDIQNIEFSQTIPPYQDTGTYSLEMTLTLIMDSGP